MRIGDAPGNQMDLSRRRISGALEGNEHILDRGLRPLFLGLGLHSDRDRKLLLIFVNSKFVGQSAKEAAAIALFGVDPSCPIGVA